MSRPRFLAFYLACGVLATAVQVAVDPAATAPLIGASGAVAGVLGAYLVLHPRARVVSVVPLGVVFPVIEVPAWILLGLWFGLQALEGVLAFRDPDVGVAFFAHVGGFVAGAALVLPFTLGRRGRRSRRRA